MGATTRSGAHLGEGPPPPHHANGAPPPPPAPRPTLSLAVAASCVENCATLELATLLAGQVARAAAIFRVDEVVVVDDRDRSADGDGAADGSDNTTAVGAAAALFARVLQYAETPQYLRRALVPMHGDLRFAGALPPLDAPHHLRASEWAPFREGVVQRCDVDQSWSLVDVGLDAPALVAAALRPGARVTLRTGGAQRRAGAGGAPAGAPPGCLLAELAPPRAPADEAGLYWGYRTRLAPSLRALFEGCPFPGSRGRYDLLIGTSERGAAGPAAALALPPHRHALLAVGGPEGLERALRHDRSGWAAERRAAAAKGGRPAAADDPAPLFDAYLNTCAGQGSRTIRTEEAVLISLAYLQPALERCR